VDKFKDIDHSLYREIARAEHSKNLELFQGLPEPLRPGIVLSVDRAGDERSARLASEKYRYRLGMVLLGVGLEPALDEEYYKRLSRMVILGEANIFMLMYRHFTLIPGVSLSWSRDMAQALLNLAAHQGAPLNQSVGEVTALQRECARVASHRHNSAKPVTQPTLRALRQWWLENDGQLG
jgi:hypothetical protein